MADKLIAEKHLPGKGPGGVPITRTVRLYRHDGRLVCECPYACLATYERCEFADYEEPNWLRRLIENITQRTPAPS